MEHRILILKGNPCHCMCAPSLYLCSIILLPNHISRLKYKKWGNKLNYCVLILSDVCFLEAAQEVKKEQGRYVKKSDKISFAGSQLEMQIFDVLIFCLKQK